MVECWFVMPMAAGSSPVFFDNICFIFCRGNMNKGNNKKWGYNSIGRVCALQA